MHWIFCLFGKGNTVRDFFQRILVVSEPQRKGYVCVIGSDRGSRLILWMNMALARIVLYLHFLPSVPRELLYDLPSWTRKELDATFTYFWFFLVKKEKNRFFFSIPFLLCLKNSIKGIAKQKLLENKW